MNCVLAGVGGQGTVLASRLIAQMAMRKDLPVRTAETIGMSQCGGSVTSHVRVGATPDDGISSPLVPLGTADVVIGFELGEATRTLASLSPEGVMVVADVSIMPPSASLGKCPYDPDAHRDFLARTLGERIIFVKTEDVTRAIGSSKVTNVVLLGAACASGALQATPDELKAAVRTLVKPAFLDMDLAAVDLGVQTYQAAVGRWQA